MTTLRQRIRGRDEGATLVELLVAFGIFAILLAIVTAATLSMFQSSRKQASQGDDLDASRKVIELLDKQVRYANAITTPGTGPSGDTYVEWRTGNIGLQQTCTQWRYDPTANQLAYRSWRPTLGSPGYWNNGSLTSWTTAGSGISAVVGTPIFSITPAYLGASPAPSPAPNTKEELTVAFVTTKGKPAQSQTSQVTLTATNSTSMSAPTGSQAVCTEHVDNDTVGNRP